MLPPNRPENSEISDCEMRAAGGGRSHRRNFQNDAASSVFGDRRSTPATLLRLPRAPGTRFAQDRLDRVIPSVAIRGVGRDASPGERVPKADDSRRRASPDARRMEDVAPHPG